METEDFVMCTVTVKEGNIEVSRTRTTAGYCSISIKVTVLEVAGEGLKPVTKTLTFTNAGETDKNSGQYESDAYTLARVLSNVCGEP